MTQCSRPRLMLVTQVLGGGTGIQIQGIYGGPNLDGWDRNIVVLGGGNESAPQGASLTRLPSFEEFGRYPFAQLQGFLELRKLVRAWNPDILHVYFFWPILFGRILKALGEINCLVENREDEGFNWGLHEYAWLRLTRSHPDRVVCVSDSVRAAVLKRERMDPARVAVIPNGVPDPDKVSREDVDAARAELGIETGVHVIGMVANMNRPIKGVKFFLEAAVELLDQYPETAFLLVGGGKGLKAHRRWVEELGIGDRIFFAGFREEVAPFYELMDVSVLSSLSEGLSVTLLESMRRGIPVVATRIGGNAEVVRDGKCGRLVPPGDPSSLASAIAELLQNPRTRERMGQRARDRVRKEYPLDETADDYAHLFRSLKP